MKKTAISIISLLILTVSLTVGMSLSALADEVPAAVWDETNFGNATWTAAEGKSYTITLYYKSVTDSDFSVVAGAEDIDCGTNNSYDFIPDTPDKTGGKITADKTGEYKFTVKSTDGEVEIPSEPKAFLKLFAPINAGWNVSSNNILAEWTPNTLNSVDAGYPSFSNIAYQLTLSYEGGADISTYSIASGITSRNMNTVLQNLRGSFVFSVYATSEFAFNSDPTVVDDIDALTYPMQIDNPGSAFWGEGTSAGIAQWTPVTGASKYTVTFYKAVPEYETVLVSEKNIIVDKFYDYVTEGETAPISRSLLVSYKYAQVGQSQTVNAASGTVENPQCDLANVNVKDSGVYFFSVVASGQNNANDSAPTGFDRSLFDETYGNNTLYEFVYKVNSTSFVSEKQHHANLLNKIAVMSAMIPPEVVFDFEKTGDIRVDLNNDGIDDESQANLSVFLPIGDSVTISAARYISTGSSVHATDVPFEWNATQNASLVTLSRNGDKLTMTGINEGVVTLKVTAKYSPYAGKEIKVYVSQKPTKLTISGRNSFIVAESPYQLKLAIEPESASSDSKYFKWSSNNSTVVAVDEGRITPTTTALSSSPSYAEITVESLLSGVSNTFRIAVSNEGIMPARIDVVGNNAVPLKSTLQLEANVYSDLVASRDSVFVTDPSVVWTTSNNKVATVDQSGKVTPKALGKCTITATSHATNSSHVKGSLEIEVVPEEINITKLALSGTKSITVGDKTDIKLTINPTNATDREVVWSCSGGGTISYTSELVRTLTATKEGTATITVYAKNAPSIKAEIVVTIKTASDEPETDVGKTEIITDIKPTPGTGDKKNEYTADIKEEVINEAIDKVFSEAIPLKTTPVVRIRVATPKNAVDAIIKIPYSSVYNIINYPGYRDKGVLVIETTLGTITVPPLALRSIYNQATSKGGIQFKMSKLVNTDLTEEQQEAADGRQVYSYTTTSGGEEITRFGGHAITVSIPYTITSTQSGKGVQVDYLDKGGYIYSLSTSYDYKAKTVDFETTHLSMYIPYYYAAVAWDNPFNDVSLNDWFYESVFYVVDRNLMNGISAERFVPASYTTRAMVVTILHRLAGTPSPEIANPFVDVRDGQWYTDAVLWATEMELVSGYGGGRFGPDDQVTREQLGVMLHNYAKYVDITPKYGWDTPMKYVDSVNVSSWARQGAMYCQITNIIGGRPGNRFDPQGVATRSELATMLLRMNKQMEEQIANS